MSMYQPGTLQAFLKGLGIFPKKGLSQNFLIDGNILRKIVTVSQLEPGETVLEIGPGPGALTEILLNKGAKVIAVEKDAVLARCLERLQTSDGRLTVILDDALQIDYALLLKNQGPIKVIANLPYHITTPLLTLFLPMKTLFSSIIVMVQEEVARRLTAKPKTADYSSLTLFAHFYADVFYAFKISRNCFFPAPKVDSALVSFQLKNPPLFSPESIENFFKLTRKAFGQRRKMMRTSLKELYSVDKILFCLEEMDKDPKVRPEELSLNDFLKLFSLLHVS